MPVTLIRLFLLCCILVAGATSVALLPSVLKSPRDFGLIENAEKLSNDEIVRKLQQLKPDEIQTRISSELDYLAANPLDARALQNFAILHTLDGKSEKSGDLNLLLARYSLRNVGVQLVAINTLVAREEYDEALLRLDATLRSSPEIQTQLFPTIIALVERKAALPAVAKTLSLPPPWRKNFMVHIAKTEPSGQLTYQLLKAMRVNGGELQHEELRNVLQAWIQAGEIEKAYFVWLDLLPPEELKSIKLVFDGEFSREPRHQFFDWSFTNKPNVRITVARKPGSAVERALLLDFLGFKGNFNAVSQLLRLADGPHEISYEAMSQNFKSEGGLTWRVYCHGSKSPLTTGPVVDDSVPWTPFSFTIDVPTDSCDTQVLRLETKARSGLDTAISGQVFFDDFKIERREITPEQ